MHIGGLNTASATCSRQQKGNLWAPEWSTYVGFPELCQCHRHHLEVKQTHCFVCPVLLGPWDQQIESDGGFGLLHAEQHLCCSRRGSKTGMGSIQHRRATWAMRRGCSWRTSTSSWPLATPPLIACHLWGSSKVGLRGSCSLALSLSVPPSPFSVLAVLSHLVLPVLLHLILVCLT